MVSKNDKVSPPSPHRVYRVLRRRANNITSRSLRLTEAEGRKQNCACGCLWLPKFEKRTAESQKKGGPHFTLHYRIVFATPHTACNLASIKRDGLRRRATRRTTGRVHCSTTDPKTCASRAGMELFFAICYELSPS